jgi:spermidine synthase
MLLGHWLAMSQRVAKLSRRGALLSLALSGCGPLLAIAPCAAAEPPRENFAGRLEYDGQGQFSHIRIRRSGNLRSMLFVRDTGEEAIESRINLDKPFVLQFEYLKHLFTSYLFRRPQQDVLIVGLGGGGMIHFLRHADPGVRIDAVEIDPLVVSLAEKYFGVKSGENVNVVTADGLKFIAEAQQQYDVIYLDAFLKPSADTDATGVPLSLRTQQFYQQLQTKLKPGGVAAFNINPHPQMGDDIRAITTAFPQAYEFQLPRYQGAVVIASTDPERVTRAELIKRAGALDEAFDNTISFRDMARRLRE